MGLINASQVQELQLGSFLRSTYLDPSNPSTFIAGISPDLVDINQESVGALLQDLYPPTPSFNITLANGMNVVGAFGGYQYVPVESVQPNLDISLNSFTSCPNFDLHTQAFYALDEFKAKAQAAAPFCSN
ncbi:hypothetical protein FB451DRAFT_1170981 [Mycena latifolia]|nr:hypothetical protein FB451DRAFT_1170981 [Mycena latifolia]